MSSDLEDRSWGCTAPTSLPTADTACTEMLQDVEQCPGLTDTDITTAPFKPPAAALLDLPARKCQIERDHSMLPDVQQNASNRLSSYCSQSVCTPRNGSDWSGLVSSDFEDRTSACTSPCSTASTAPISLRATDIKCTGMLQFLEQRLGLTDKDITTAPFSLPTAPFVLPASHCQAERTRVPKSTHAVCRDGSTGPNAPPRWQYLPDIPSMRRMRQGRSSMLGCWY